MGKLTPFESDVAEGIARLREEDFAFHIEPDWDVYRVAVNGVLHMVAFKLVKDDEGQDRLVVGFAQRGAHHRPEDVKSVLYYVQ